jgi:hypothetical protein
MGDPKVRVPLSTYDSRGGAGNEMRACLTRGSAESVVGRAESVVPQAPPAIAVQSSTVTLEVPR